LTHGIKAAPLNQYLPIPKSGWMNAIFILKDKLELQCQPGNNGLIGLIYASSAVFMAPQNADKIAPFRY